jgi:hypothetical protein
LEDHDRADLPFAAPASAVEEEKELVKYRFTKRSATHGSHQSDRTETKKKVRNKEINQGSTGKGRRGREGYTEMITGA